MKPPIIADYAGDLVLFDSIDQAQSWIEPPDIRPERLVLYDSERRRLKAQVIPWQGKQKILGIALATKGEQVILSDSALPAKPEELKAALVTFLTASNVEGTSDYNKEALSTRSLDELIKLLSSFLRRTK